MTRLILTAVVLVLSASAASAQSVFISELMVGDDKTYCDSFGDDPDWLEIHNPSDVPVNLAGWTLTDRPSKSVSKWTFPPDTIVRPGGYLVVFFENRNVANRTRKDGNDIHTNFRLNAVKGEVIVLVNPKQVEVHRVRFGPQQRNVSIGTSDPDRPLVPQKWPTPGVANDAPQPPSRCKGSR